MNTRIGWAQLPPQVRAGVESILGDPVVDARSQPGGFSPGSADRLLLASGRRVFVKAASADVNASTAALHRREASVSASLPPGVPAPQLLGIYDDGNWVALILADVTGRHPEVPWREEDIATVLAALAELARQPLPQDMNLPRYEDALRGAFQGWEKLQRRPTSLERVPVIARQDGPRGEEQQTLNPWTESHLAELALLAREGVDFLAGNALVHGDLRADNILLVATEPDSLPENSAHDAHGAAARRAVLIDWPWAAVGSSWADALSILVNVKTLDADADVEQWLTGHEAFSGASQHAVNCVLAGLAGYFMDQSRRPAPPGIPTLRAFQRQQGDAIVSWLAQRLS